MAVLPTRSFSSIVATVSTGMQARAGIFITFVKGSVFLAFAEAYAGVGLWLQRLALSVAKLTRLATSYGTDADSWLADWGVTTRIGSVAATGSVTFGRKTVSGSSPLVPVGGTVRTQDGKSSFVVYADTTNVYYDPSVDSYRMPAQVASIIVPVRCTTPSPNGTVLGDGTFASGANGNVAAGSITTITSQMPGVDTVTNVAAFFNGSDQESDPAVKSRFQLELQALSRGTPVAITAAVRSIQTNLQVKILDGANPDGSVNPGLTSVVVDDGSGSIADSLLQQVLAAVNTVRAAGVRVVVYAGLLRPVQVQLTLLVAPGYVKQLVAAQLSAAVAAQINAGGLGVGVDFYTVAAWAKAVPGVAKIEGLTVNGGNLDIPGDPRYTLKSSGVLVN